jgi:hypothetical protein
VRFEQNTSFNLNLARGEDHQFLDPRMTLDAQGVINDSNIHFAAFKVSEALPQQ